MILNPVQYVGDKSSSLPGELNLSMPSDYALMDEERFIEKYPKLVERFGGYENLGKSNDFKYLAEYAKALVNQKGYKPRGIFSRPWGADYTVDIEDKGDWDREAFDKQVAVAPTSTADLANAVLNYKPPKVVLGPTGPMNLDPYSGGGIS